MQQWYLSDRVLHLDGRALVMGIVNVTPDSFSDGGQHSSTESVVAHALALVQQGADILDVGGESSRPGAEPVSLADELQRVVPVIRELVKRTSVPISVDTTKAAVADACLAEGAHIINDITALTGDADMSRVAASHKSGVVLMHMQGTPQTMQTAPHYDDIVVEVMQYLETRLNAVVDAGIAKERVVLDPGIGFGKSTAHNLRLLARLPELQRLGRPVCLGVSRKGFLGKFTGPTLERRITASLAVACDAVVRGAAQIVRVHDVEQTHDALAMLDALRNRGREE